MKLILIALLFAAAAFAQTVADVQNDATSAETNNTEALTVTASGGDGSACTITKQAGSTIVAAFSCVSGDGKTVLKSGTLRSSGTTPQTLPAGFGDVLCLLAINPTTAAVTLGSLGAIPPNGLGWSCSTNIRTLGGVSGQTVPVQGSVTWP